MHPIRSQWIDFPISDGSTMRTYVARPLGLQQTPGLLVFQEIFGVNAHIRDITERFAREGFTTLAPELFHRSTPGFESGYESYEPGRAEAAKMTLEGLAADLQGLGDWFAKNPQTANRPLGSIGYCMGGRISYLANTMAPLQCAVSYYGGNIQNHLDRADRLSGPMLMIWAGQDSIISLDHRRQIEDTLRGAHKSFIEVEFAEADHGFFCDQRSQYQASSARIVWALTLAFLREHLEA